MSATMTPAADCELLPGGGTCEVETNAEGTLPDLSRNDNGFPPKNGQLIPDLAEAAFALELLGEGDTAFTFQTYCDAKATQQQPDPLARIFHGSLVQHADELIRLNQQGAGVFVTVNRTDGRGRRRGNITGIRAIFQEDDGDGKPLPVEPHFTVESSPGKFHRYILTSTAKVEEFEPVQGRVVADYGSDPNAADLGRVLRLAGFIHQKNPTRPHLVRVVAFSGAPRLAWEEVKRVFPPVIRTKKPVKEASGPAPDLNVAEIESALAALDPNMGYADWLQVGQALHDGFGGGAEGLALWDEWSSEGGTYHEGECEYKWDTFTAGGGITIKTLFKMAADAGWRWQGNPEEDFDDLAAALAEPDRKPRKGWRLLAEDEYLAPSPRPDWLAEDAIICGSLATLAGQANTLKTFLHVGLAVAITAGLPWFGRPTKQGPVVMILGEGNRGIGARILAARLGLGIAPEVKLPLLVSTAAVTVPDKGEMEMLADALAAVEEQYNAPPALVIFDTLSRCFGGKDENGTADMNLFVNHLDRFIPPETAVLVVHHMGLSSNDRARGSSALYGAVDAEFLVKRENGLLSIRNTKQKDAPQWEQPLTLRPRSIIVGVDAEGPVDSLYLEMTTAPDMPVATSSAMEQALAVLRELGGTDNQGIAKGVWRRACVDKKVYAERSFFGAITNLERKRLIRCEGEMVFVTPQNGCR